MAKVFENQYGFYISHKKYIDGLYRELDKPLEINPKLFNIKRSYKNHKNKVLTNNDKQETIPILKEQEDVKTKFELFMADFSQTSFLSYDDGALQNTEALETAQFVYETSGRYSVNNAHGANIGGATIKNVGGGNFLFPQNSTFFSKDIADIEKYLLDLNYDLILLDPPWWNKYIRRKRKRSGDAYNMLYNDNIKNLPIETLLKDEGMVIVWCTNSQQHITNLTTQIFSKWNVKYIGKWYWVKVTLTGKPICSFSPPPGKQPYEQIIFGCRGNFPSIPFESKLVVSVPSAIHSHKPPLIKLIKRFLPDNPSCLEIFARYLMPNWTSYGNEVLRLQHECLFVDV